METSCGKLKGFGGAVAQLGARLDGIEEVVGSNPIGSTKFFCAVCVRLAVKNSEVSVPLPWLQRAMQPPGRFLSLILCAQTRSGKSPAANEVSK